MNTDGNVSSEPLLFDVWFVVVDFITEFQFEHWAVWKQCSDEDDDDYNALIMQRVSAACGMRHPKRFPTPR